MTTDTRYPIGRFVPPDHADDDTISRWRRDIEEFPGLLSVAVAGLADAQLDTPYREAGWTVRQLVHHMADSHMNAYCRFKLALTEENPTIKLYAEALWAELPEARALSVQPSLAVLEGLHQRWVAMIVAMTPAQRARTYHHPASVQDVPLWRTIGLYAWHCRHHLAHITLLRTSRGW